MFVSYFTQSGGQACIPRHVPRHRPENVRLKHWSKKGKECEEPSIHCLWGYKQYVKG